MSAISATRGTYRETADGSLEVKIIIDPRFKNDFHRLFSEKDMPVAIAPLVADFERKEEPATQSAQEETDHIEDALEMVDRKKGGALARLAGQWCNLQSFYDWIRPIYDRMLGGNGSGTGDIYIAEDGDIPTAKLFCKHAILVFCEIESRAELDHDPIAAEKFHRLIRLPYAEYLKGLA